MEKIIRQQDIFDKASAVRHMCKALEFINKRKKFLVNYTKEHFIYQITQCYENLVLGREIKGTIIVVTFWNIILDMQQIMQVG
ncbi:hypothetical protein GLOIN_2v1776526 [Rhizophagus irregularis DAOM 181602=DAOM 197198]|uniref:Uncharacterized protein n=1 Tax=Rhizophagus irregularis (strain DAOM 181602 / DAOM 197198 / MUCL 43194) TaxID=747089 RepID=A0A2P4PWT2_RHIID|nr:hypothetical protein GLOIN_2v1776526 [Rhizophagus irregularis DAOM 181602=DAOM 197198]POG69832.1 hypothetical protein GLOIN_2v1776526 [Rhizophagus irregularis DAOM 181602=DAOM 197198]|eukprot:XP_025176698.1 hypothetical protein GLOIN_2v1776526 [Rhizophagus irregularis DAOM 181602=DAOM 197198]